MKNEPWPADIPAQEVLWDMRRNGCPKPENVPSAIWTNLKSISYNHENIVDLMLLGYTKKEVAEKLEIDPQTIYRVTSAPTFLTYYRERRINREEAVSRDGITELFPRAIDTIGEIMQDKNEKGSTRLSASQFIVEQSIGKAKQEVKVESHMLADVIAKVEELKLVGQLPAYLDKPKDYLDDIVSNFTQGKFTEIPQHEGSQHGDTKAGEAESELKPK